MTPDNRTAEETNGRRIDLENGDGTPSMSEPTGLLGPLSRRGFAKASAFTASALALGIGMSPNVAAGGGGGGSNGGSGSSSDHASSGSVDTTAVSTDLVTVPLFVADEAGNLAPFDDADTELYEIREHNPIRAPDGHHVTWGEFDSVQGLIYVDCLETNVVEEPGTGVVVLLSGLIPNAVYTIWNVTWKEPGFDPERDPEFENLVGLGALGSSDGRQNTFRASASGLGAVGATTPGGELSMQGEIGACALTDEFEWHVVGAYHLDDRAHGPDLGPDGTAVEQFGFVFGGGE